MAAWPPRSPRSRPALVVNHGSARRAYLRQNIGRDQRSENDQSLDHILLGRTRHKQSWSSGKFRNIDHRRLEYKKITKLNAPMNDLRCSCFRKESPFLSTQLSVSRHSNYKHAPNTQKKMGDRTSDQRSLFGKKITPK